MRPPRPLPLTRLVPGLIVAWLATTPHAQAASKLIQVMREHIINSGILPEAETSPEYVIGTIIAVILGLLGILFFLLIIYSGYLWMTAQGAEEQVSKAKKIILSATVGLAIILAAYLITFTLLQILLPPTQQSAPAPEPEPVGAPPEGGMGL